MLPWLSVVLLFLFDIEVVTIEPGDLMFCFNKKDLPQLHKREGNYHPPIII